MVKAINPCVEVVTHSKSGYSAQLAPRSLQRVVPLETVHSITALEGPWATGSHGAGWFLERRFFRTLLRIPASLKCKYSSQESTRFKKCFRPRAFRPSRHGQRNVKPSYGLDAEKAAQDKLVGPLK